MKTKHFSSDIHIYQSQGVSAPNAAFLISVGGICNTVGRFVGGAISDLSWVQPLHLTCLTLAASLVNHSIIHYYLITLRIFYFVDSCVCDSVFSLLLDLPHRHWDGWISYR